MSKINMQDLREDDILYFDNGECLTIKKIAYNVSDHFYYVQVSEDMAFRYTEMGKCEFPQYSIKKVDLVERPEDSITYYVPNLFIQPSPVLTVKIKGAKKPVSQKIINSIMSLNEMGPYYKGEILTAEVLPVVFAELRKCRGRDVTVLKTEHIFCKNMKEAEEKLKELQERFNKKAEEESENESGSEVKRLPELLRED